jgi:hypothetical protein
MTSETKEPMMPTTLSLDLTRIRARRARVTCLLLLAALAGAACSDQTGPTSPDTDGGAVSGGAADARRTPFISDLRLRSTTLYVGSNGIGITPDYELTNPGGKTSGLYIRGELRQGSVNLTSPYALVPCGQQVPGTIRRGTCSGAYGLLIPTTGLLTGPAQFTLRLSQMVNNVATTIDSRTVEVYIIRN